MYEFFFFQSPTFEILDLYMQKMDRTRPVFFADELCTVYCSLFETLISTEFGRLHEQILYFPIIFHVLLFFTSETLTLYQALIVRIRPNPLHIISRSVLFLVY